MKCTTEQLDCFIGFLESSRGDFFYETLAECLGIDKADETNLDDEDWHYIYEEIDECNGCGFWTRNCDLEDGPETERICWECYEAELELEDERLEGEEDGKN